MKAQQSKVTHVLTLRLEEVRIARRKDGSRALAPVIPLWYLLYLSR